MLELATLTIASLVAGFVNAIAGGGGLISLLLGLYDGFFGSGTGIGLPWKT